MRRRGFLGFLLAAPLVRYAAPSIVMYDSVTTKIPRYTMVKYAMRIEVSREAIR